MSATSVWTKSTCERTVRREAFRESLWPDGACRSLFTWELLGKEMRPTAFDIPRFSGGCAADLHGNTQEEAGLGVMTRVPKMVPKVPELRQKTIRPEGFSFELFRQTSDEVCGCKSNSPVRGEGFKAATWAPICARSKPRFSGLHLASNTATLPARGRSMAVQ